MNVQYQDFAFLQPGVSMMRAAEDSGLQRDLPRSTSSANQNRTCFSPHPYSANSDFPIALALHDGGI
jgi:hypothetical protein